MNHRPKPAAAATILLAAFGAVALASPAAADVTAHAAIPVTFPSTTMANVCPVGTVDDGVGEWLFEADGARADGTQIHLEQTGFGATFNPCFYVSTNGTSDGGFVGTLYFARIGAPSPAGASSSGTAPEFTAVAVVEVDWTPHQDTVGTQM